MKINLIKIMEEAARKKPVKILVCEAHDERMLKASAEILKRKLAKIIISGNLEIIKEKAKKLKLDIKNAEILDFKNSELKEELAEKLAEIRKHKGMTLEEAKK